MSYQIYETLGREEMKKVDRGITMINHTQAEAIRVLTNILCQVGITTIIDKFLILDIPIDRDAPIVVEYQIKRNKFGAPIYGPKPAPYLNCNDPAERSIALQVVINPFWKISDWKKAVSFLGSLPVPLKQVNWKPDSKGRYTKEEEEATGHWHTEIRLTDPYGNIYLQGVSNCIEHLELDDPASSSFPTIVYTSRTINNIMYGYDGGKVVAGMRCLELCYEFYLTYEFQKVYADDELQTKKIIKFRLGRRAHSLTLLEFARR
nr:hypothetical protein [Tanacetum cinerariifolium]GEZ63756.1 hypothetical protein [Tanacetum cinerariifolium]